MNRFLSIFLAIAVLAGCAPDPAADNFAAPKLGEVTVDAEAFQARVSCHVEGETAGIATYGFRFGKDALREIPATLADGQLSATIKGLSPETIYHVEAFMGNGSVTLFTETITFSTDKSEETVDIPDPVFRRFILENFDENHDDVLTVPEAQKITELTVCTDSIYSMKGLEKMSRLRKLVADGSPWGYGQLQEIDLSGNTLLEFCHLESNQLHSVDISHNPLLWNFSACVNPLDSIDFSHNPKLTEIGINSTDLTGLPDMTFLHLGSLHMGGVARYMPEDYFHHFPELFSFNIGDFKGRFLDLSQNPYISSVWCDNSPLLEELDLTASIRTKMEHIHANNCPQLRRIILRPGVTIDVLEKDAHTEIVYSLPL